MRKSKKKCKTILTVFMCLPILSACTSSDPSHESLIPTPEGKKNLYEHPGLSKYDSTVELRLIRENSDRLEQLIHDLPGESLEDNRWSRLYKQVLGVDIKYDWVAKGDLYFQKLGVALASGKLPDVVQVNAQQLRLLSNAGLIQELTTVYNEYATPFTKEILSQEGLGPFEAATIDGRLMAIPVTGSSIERAQFIWIRTDWMKQLGLKPPRTMDDVLAISKAFTTRDPDGNGKKDTYGLALTQYLFDPVMGITGFMAGYGAYPTIWIKDAAGKLVYGGIQPEVKSALKVLQDLYKSGQLDREFGYKNGVKAQPSITEGKIGMFYGEQWGSFLAQTSRPNSEWQAFPIVSASGQLSKVPLKFSTSQFLVVRKDYEYPEAIMKLINLHLEKNWGETAEYETYYSTPLAVWGLSPVTPFPARKNLEAFYQIEEARRTGNFYLLRDEAKAIHKNIDQFLNGNSSAGWGWERTYGPSGAFAILDQYIQKGQLLYEDFVGPPTETMIDKDTILYDLQINSYVNIILGRPIDEFDRFVEKWRMLGGDKITDEVNHWYTSKPGASE